MRRSIWLPIVVLPVGALLALLIAALQPVQIRAYALSSPDGGQAAALARGQQACEGPIRLPSAIGGVRIWGGTAAGLAVLDVTVSDASTGRALGNGQIIASPAVGAYDAALENPVPAGSSVRVCVLAHGPAPFSLLGSLPTHPEIHMSVDGKTMFSEFSLVLLEPSRKSLLAALPTAFSRAALFRFSWVGPWTFWVLLVALLGTFALCGWAVAAAARADLPGEPTPEAETEDALPAHPSGQAR
ncbi:MAG TPA: hypothetical protein VMB27_08900 [Solirubrobacteraceae bacterium]|nr:hypothetical protein [Solirubrobacteraceae bacterium]